MVGASGRAILQAIIEGETDAGKLAALARGTLRNKIPQLRLALEGRITDHHRFLLRQSLDTLDFVESKIADKRSMPF